MKPQHVIAFVVVAVLVTVAIEETRISKMRAEIIRLRAIPPDEPSDIEAIVEKTVDLNDPAQKLVEPEAIPEVAPETGVPKPPSPPVTGRVIPEDFPNPDDATIKQLAVGPYSDFCYEVGLNNRERAYLDELLKRRTRSLQEAAAKWIAAPASQRSEVEDSMTLIVANSDDAIATFLGSDRDTDAFASYHDRQPERELLTTMAPSLDAAGATLEIEKEKQLVEALYQARVGTGSLDWNSSAGLKALTEGDPLERFEEGWKSQSNALAGLLPKFLSEAETAAVMEGREALKPDMLASIESAIEAVIRNSE